MSNSFNHNSKYGRPDHDRRSFRNSARWQDHHKSAGRRGTKHRQTKVYGKNRMCYDKTVYPTELDAIHACMQTSKKYGAMRYYHCPYGDHYHLTSQVTSLPELEQEEREIAVAVAPRVTTIAEIMAACA